jgi:hypothetical protein
MNEELQQTKQEFISNLPKTFARCFEDGGGFEDFDPRVWESYQLKDFIGSKDFSVIAPESIPIDRYLKIRTFFEEFSTTSPARILLPDFQKGIYLMDLESQVTLKLLFDRELQKYSFRNISKYSIDDLAKITNKGIMFTMQGEIIEIFRSNMIQDSESITILQHNLNLIKQRLKSDDFIRFPTPAHISKPQKPKIDSIPVKQDFGLNTIMSPERLKFISSLGNTQFQDMFNLGGSFDLYDPRMWDRYPLEAFGITKSSQIFVNNEILAEQFNQNGHSVGGSIKRGKPETINNSADFEKNFKYFVDRVITEKVEFCAVVPVHSNQNKEILDIMDVLSGRVARIGKSKDYQEWQFLGYSRFVIDLLSMEELQTQYNLTFKILNSKLYQNPKIISAAKMRLANISKKRKDLMHQHLQDPET